MRRQNSEMRYFLTLALMAVALFMYVLSSTSRRVAVFQDVSIVPLIFINIYLSGVLVSVVYKKFTIR